MANNHRVPGTPGVYLEEVTPERAPGFRTGVPVLVGFVEPAPDSGGRSAGANDNDNETLQCHTIERWEQFERQVGRAVPEGFLDYAVRGFFENGGERCVVVPIRLAERDPGALKDALQKLFEEDGFLERIEDIDLICVPDLMMEAIRASWKAVLEVQITVLEHCWRMRNRFAILDAFPTQAGAQADGRPALKDLQHAMLHWYVLPEMDGALYFPWLRVERLPRVPPTKDRSGILVPPCGHVAGVYARTDARVGVHKAPANEVVEGVVDLEVNPSDADQEQLNQFGVNCLRILPGRGIRVWGARTMSPKPDWRYVNVWRLFLTLSRWLERNMNDLVFEPNGPLLWERVRYRLGSYCYELFQQGALKGRHPAEAFFVKCDAENNPLEVRESGQVIAEVGLASIMPAEFVIVRITQSAAGTTVGIPTGS